MPGKKLTWEERKSREDELDAAAGLMFTEDVFPVSDIGHHVIACDSGYGGRTVNIVRCLHGKFDMSHRDLNSPFAHPGAGSPEWKPILLAIYRKYTTEGDNERLEALIDQNKGYEVELLQLMAEKYGFEVDDESRTKSKIGPPTLQDPRRCRECGLITDPPHWGNECPLRKPASSSSSSKRPAPDDDAKEEDGLDEPERKRRRRNKRRR